MYAHALCDEALTHECTSYISYYLIIHLYTYGTHTCINIFDTYNTHTHTSQVLRKQFVGALPNDKAPQEGELIKAEDVTREYLLSVQQELVLQVHHHHVPPVPASTCIQEGGCQLRMHVY
jgi:hypothetical protein